MLSLFIILEGLAILFGLYPGDFLHYADIPLLYKIDTEGPYVFYKNDSSVHANYVKRNKDDEFYVDKKKYNIISEISLSILNLILYALILMKSAIYIPKTTSKNGNTILAISDIGAVIK